MTNEKPKEKKNPLDGLKLAVLLTELSDHYGWLPLSEALNIERFQFHTGLKSTMKFLRNHEWAKEKVENFYLYFYKNFDWPDDKQLSIPPRDRSSLGEPNSEGPAEITAETNRFIEHASDVRGAKKEKTSKNWQKEEPTYNPENPWNE